MSITNTFRMSIAARLLRRPAIGLLGVLALTSIAILPVQSATAATVRFGAPTWPGVTVKTEVASQLVQAMGFKTKTMSASPAFIVAGLKSDNLDVYFGGWMPIEEDMIKPAARKGDVKILAKNISGAVMGLAVPDYVWDAGVHSVGDLVKHGDKFDHKIYGIEPGSGFNKAIKEEIDNDRHGLGDWKLVKSNASVMLTQVKRAVKRKKWIVFLGWQPHWMNIVYDMKYLKEDKPKIADTRSDVLTVVNPKLVKKNPEVTRFLKQFVVTKKDQSKWIYEYSNQHHKASDIASKWIGNHMDQVGKWMKDVKTRDGDPAIKAIKAKFQS